MSNLGECQPVPLSFCIDQLLNIVTSLDELTRFSSKLHLNLMAIENIRSQYEDFKVENKTLSKISKFEVWEKARIKDVIRRVDQLVPEDASPLVVVLKRHGKDMANEQWVCFLNSID